MMTSRIVAFGFLASTASVGFGPAYAGSVGPTLSVIASYGPVAGAEPEGGLIADSLGVTPGGLIGVATHGKAINTSGSIELFTPPSAGSGPYSVSTIHAFSGVDGADPQGILLPTSYGLMGATFVGGAYGQGTIYVLNANGASYSFTKLLDFGSPSCAAIKPHGNLVFGLGGMIYGDGGVDKTGTGGNGSIFELVPPGGTATGWGCLVLKAFSGGTDGASPQWLMAAPSGVLYYVNNTGGPNGAGDVESLTPTTTDPAGSWTRSVLHAFPASASDGKFPLSPLYQDASGDLIGTTSTGGGKGEHGTMYMLTPPSGTATSWGESTLHVFTGTTTDGVDPKGRLYFKSNGAIYGVAKAGGADNLGIVYTMTPSSSGYSFSVVYSFTGGLTDGATPHGGLDLVAPGVLAGNTDKGGVLNKGVAFLITNP